MNMKKCLASAAACLAAALLLAGCAESHAETSGADNTESAVETAISEDAKPAVETAISEDVKPAMETAGGSAAGTSSAEEPDVSGTPVVYFTSDRSRKITALRRSRTLI